MYQYTYIGVQVGTAILPSCIIRLTADKVSGIDAIMKEYTSNHDSTANFA